MIVDGLSHIRKNDLRNTSNTSKDNERLHKNHKHSNQNTQSFVSISRKNVAPTDYAPPRLLKARKKGKNVSLTMSTTFNSPEGAGAPNEPEDPSGRVLPPVAGEIRVEIGKSRAAATREAAALAKFDALRGKVERRGKRKTIFLLSPAEHLTKVCFASFQETLRRTSSNEAGVWTASREKATEKEKERAKTTRKTPCFKVFVTFSPSNQGNKAETTQGAKAASVPQLQRRKVTPERTRAPLQARENVYIPPPPPSPVLWTEAFDPQNRRYYWNMVTRQSVWVLPQGVSAVYASPLRFLAAMPAVAPVAGTKRSLPQEAPRPNSNSTKVPKITLASPVGQLA
jgi:WW domain